MTEQIILNAESVTVTENGESEDRITLSSTGRKLFGEVRGEKRNITIY